MQCNIYKKIYFIRFVPTCITALLIIQSGEPKLLAYSTSSRYPTKESEDKEQQMVSMSEQAGSDKKIIKVKDGNELVFIQENLFSVTIIPPGVKPFEIQVMFCITCSCFCNTNRVWQIIISRLNYYPD